MCDRLRIVYAVGFLGWIASPGALYAQADDGVPGESQQGSILEGSELPGLALRYDSGIDAFGMPWDSVQLERTTLTAYRGGLPFTGSDLDGTRFLGTTPDGIVHMIVIRYLAAHENPYPPRQQLPPGQSNYQVTYDGGNPLCGMDAANRSMPVAGSWDLNGRYVPAAAFFSFACLGAVVVKCIDWGYVPWRGYTGLSIYQDPPTPQPLVNYTGPAAFESCADMARANYCRDGRSYTIDRTTISFYDALGRSVDPGTPGLDFEAAWVPGTTVPAVLCLSKLRWSTRVPGDRCNGLLPDPRVHTTVKYCDDYTNAELVARGALLFNGSSTIDAGLYNWSNAAGTRSLATSRFNDGGAPPCLPAGPQFEGAAFNPSASPNFLPPPPLAVLQSYVAIAGGCDYVTTLASEVPPGYGGVPTTEGLIFPVNYPNLPSTAVRLYRYTLAGGGYLTTTRELALPRIPLGYLAHNLQ